MMPKRGTSSHKGKSTGKAKDSKALKKGAKQTESEGVVITVRKKSPADAAGDGTPPREGKVIDANLTSAALENLELRVSKPAKQPKRSTKTQHRPPKNQQKTPKAKPETLTHKRTFRLPRPIRNMLISAAVLLVVLLAAGALYTLFMDGSGKSGIATTPVNNTIVDAQPIQPHKPAPNAAESAAVQIISSPNSPGSEASINVKTNPDSACTIAVMYNKIPASDPGLVKKTADDFGDVSWSWTISPGAPLGTWPVTVTCAYDLHSAVVQGDLLVQ